MTTYNRRVSPKTIEETYTDNDVPRDEPNKYGVREYTAYDRSIGFQFDYPMRWLNDKSDFKAVGIRRIKVIPTTHTFDLEFNILLSWYEIEVTPHHLEENEENDIDYYILKFKIYDMNRSGYKPNNPNYYLPKDEPLRIHIDMKVLHDNYSNEILTNIVDQINTKLHTGHRSVLYWYAESRVSPEDYEDNFEYPLDLLNDTFYVSGSGKFTMNEAYSVPDNIRFDYEYDNSTGELTLGHTYTGGDNFCGVFQQDTVLNLPRQSGMSTLTEQTVHPSVFYLRKSPKLNNTNLVSFLKLLNQPISDSLLEGITTKQTVWTFDDVWDREVLQAHASFSDNNRGFIGLNGDFYEKPSVLYEPPTNSSNFSVWFTTDGHHRILLRYCRFFVGLCFIRNYNTSLATK